MTTREWRGVAAAIVCAAALSSVPVAAHPGAATDVTLTFHRGGRVTAAITTGRTSLGLKLQALAPDSDRPRVSNEVHAIAGYQHVLIDHIDLAADDVPLRMSWVGTTAPADPADQRAGKIVVTLEATLPEGAANVTWRTDIVYGSYMLIVKRDDVDADIRWLQGPETSELIRVSGGSAGAGGTSWASGIVTGIVQGFVHIVPRGLDHILFVLGLFLLSPQAKPLLLQVTIFTVAHSVTLALTSAGLIGLPSNVVEPLIALSIIYVAFENLVRARLTRSRLALIFAFGLLHGMGFARVLADIDLPRTSLLSTVASFNVGVELGQLAVVAAATLAVQVLSVEPGRYRTLVARPASLAIAAAGAWWFIERLS